MTPLAGLRIAQVTARVAVSDGATGPTGADATSARPVTAPVTGPRASPKLLRSNLATDPTGADATGAGAVTAAVTGAKTPPKFLAPKFERMPAELKLLKNWVLWVPIWTGSKWTKRPIQVSGFGVSTTNSKHWSTFEDVKHAYERAIQRGYIELREKDEPVQQIPIRGIGFVFDGKLDKDGLVFAGVDFDKVISAG